jgi:hypothetical protein
MDKPDIVIIPDWWILAGIGIYIVWNSRDKAKLKRKQKDLEHKQEILELKYEMCKSTEGVKEE